MMSEIREIVDEFNRATRNVWTAEYDFVNAILLHWNEDDLGVQSEVNKLQALLKEDFRFNTNVYTIPSENPGAQLNYELAYFIKTNSLQKRSLSIIYYAGHADDVEEDPIPGYSEWRA